MFRDSDAFSGFSVNDLAAAKKFYGQTLGLEVGEDPMGLWLKTGGGHGIFVYPKDDHIPASYTILNFRVADIGQVVTELAAKGVQFEQYEGMHQDDAGIAHGIAANMGPDIAWFKDPAGNILAVLQEA